jgi:hypothetical protein
MVEGAAQEFTTPAVFLLGGDAIDVAKYIERHLPSPRHSTRCPTVVSLTMQACVLDIRRWWGQRGDFAP